MNLIPQKRCQRLLVTGASGFIGRNLVIDLVSRGFGVRVLTRDMNRCGYSTDIETCIGDLTDPESLSGIAEGIHGVVHCAGSLGRWNTDEAELHEVNVQGSTNLLEQFSGKRLHRFVHLSAGGVTGPVGAVQADETYCCKPVTAYEKSKYAGEQEVLRVGKQLGLPIIVVRPTFVYGPGDDHKLGLYKSIAEGRFAFVGDGKSVNTPVYISDLIQGICLAVEKGSCGQIYIIGGEKPVTKEDLVYAIADALGVTRPRARIPRWIAWYASIGVELLGRRVGYEPILTRSRVMMMADDYAYSSRKAARDLGYRPTVTLTEGIHAAIKAYRKEGLL